MDKKILLYENCRSNCSQKFLNTIFFITSRSMLRIILTGNRFKIYFIMNPFVYRLCLQKFQPLLWMISVLLEGKKNLCNVGVMLLVLFVNNIKHLQMLLSNSFYSFMISTAYTCHGRSRISTDINVLGGLAT